MINSQELELAINDLADDVATNADDISAIKRDLSELGANYKQKIQALEKRLELLETMTKKGKK